MSVSKNNRNLYIQHVISTLALGNGWMFILIDSQLSRRTNDW
uniref:Uncharacterized protein n=1 Tax=Anguilla anguilla TaxID=7936 RepID=A0A0E9W8W6_ANGAN